MEKVRKTEVIDKASKKADTGETSKVKQTNTKDPIGDDVVNDEVFKIP